MTAPPESGTSPDDPVPEVTVRVSGLSKRFDEVRRSAISPSPS